MCCKEIKSPTNDGIFNNKKATTVSHPNGVLALKRVAKVYLGILLNAMAIEANRVWNGSTLILRWTTWRLQEAGKSLIHLKNLQWGSRRRKPPTFYTSLSEFRGNIYPMVSQLTGSTWFCLIALSFVSFLSPHVDMSSSHIYIAWLPSRDQVAWQNGGSHVCERLWKQILDLQKRVLFKGD